MKPHLEGRVLICFISLSFLFFLSCSPPPTLGAPDPDPGLPRKSSGPAWEGLPGRGRDATAEMASWAPHPAQVVLAADGEFPVGRGSQPLTLIPWGTARAKVSSAQNSGPTGQSHCGRAAESRWPNAGSSNRFCK